jgi:hypothetical protein
MRRHSRRLSIEGVGAKVHGQGWAGTVELITTHTRVSLTFTITGERGVLNVLIIGEIRATR